MAMMAVQIQVVIKFNLEKITISDFTLTGQRPCLNNQTCHFPNHLLSWFKIGFAPLGKL